MKARDIMTQPVQTVPADAPLKDCMTLMVNYHLSGLPVVHGERVVGIITQGDLIKRLRPQIPWAAFFIDGMTMPVAGDLSPQSLHDVLVELRERPVRQLMTPHVISVSPDQEVEEVAKILVDRRLKRLPVIEDHRLVGIISRGDLVRAMLQG